MNEMFRKFAYKTSEALGSPISFVIALCIVIGWAAAGPLYNYSITIRIPGSLLLIPALRLSRF